MKFNDIIKVDKVAHFGVCFAITTILSAFFNNAIGPVIGMGAALTIGLAKEIYDALKGGEFSLGDLVADFLGLASAGLCVSILMHLL